MQSLHPKECLAGSLVQSKRKLLSGAIFGVWFLLTSLICAWMVAQHDIPMPAAKGPSHLNPAPKATARHYLGVDCPCSASIVESLAERGASRDTWREEVYLIGRDTAMEVALRRGAFEVTVLEGDEALRSHGVEGAPWLMLYRPSGDLAYSGGYALTRPGVRGTLMRDTDIMAEVLRGGTPAPLPAYGCATSMALRKRLDPFGFKYTQQP